MKRYEISRQTSEGWETQEVVSPGELRDVLRHMGMWTPDRERRLRALEVGDAIRVGGMFLPTYRIKAVRPLQPSMFRPAPEPQPLDNDSLAGLVVGAILSLGVVFGLSLSERRRERERAERARKDADRKAS